MFLKADGDENDIELFDFGTCALHVGSGSYKAGHNATKWKIHEYLRSTYFLFNDFPSRRADFTYHSKVEKFPLKFCAIRWVENVSVLKRSIELIEPLKKYIKGVAGKPPLSNNYHKVKSALEDPLLKAKLEFMLVIAGILEHFLTYFQSKEPLLPFLYNETFNLMKNISRKFLKTDVFDKIKTSLDIMQIDCNDEKNLKSISDIDIGFGAKNVLKNSGLKEIDKLQFKKQCLLFLQTVFNKLKDKYNHWNHLTRLSLK